MKELLARGKRDALWGAMALCWLLTVLVSFWGDAVWAIRLPAVGAIFPFRILLPITAVLYLLWAIREKDCFWKNVSALEKWCYLFIAVMLIYGAASLPRAIEFDWTFRRLFNLCFDLCFFFLMLRLCRDKKLLRATLAVACAMAVIFCAAGIYEVFRGGIFNDANDDWAIFELFFGTYHAPLVTFGHSNDYCAAMNFTTASVILALAGQQKRLSRGQGLLLGLGLPVLYFLTQAASARFSIVVVYVLLLGLTLWILVQDWKKLWVPALALVLMLGVQFANEYQYLIPPIQQYLVEMKEYRQQQAQSAAVSNLSASPDAFAPTNLSASPDASAPPDVPAPPKLTLGNSNKEPLGQQFFYQDPVTGEEILRDEGSAGERTRLLIHAAQCFKESHGLGMGLGNTELLARDREVVPDARIWSIHCFVARIVADYGLFVLIPLCAIAFLLLRRLLKLLLYGWRHRDRRAMGFALLYLCVLCTYPLLSTASSDAQDCIPMWLYLGMVVLVSNDIENQLTPSALT